jgi:hypothetical protein
MTTRIIINGTTINTSSRGNLVISNGRVVVDGKDVTPEARQITIEVHGDLHTIDADACDHIHVTGSVGQVKATSGDVRCGDVSGSVQCMSGDVCCGHVAGSVSTMSGDINRA